MAKLREGGLAALRELRDADNEESRAQADAEQDLKVPLTSRTYASCRRGSQRHQRYEGNQTGTNPRPGSRTAQRIVVMGVARHHTQSLTCCQVVGTKGK